MPKFFKVILCICALISGTALAVNTAIVAGGGVPHEPVGGKKRKKEVSNSKNTDT